MISGGSVGVTGIVGHVDTPPLQKLRLIWRQLMKATTARYLDGVYSPQSALRMTGAALKLPTEGLILGLLCHHLVRGTAVAAWTSMVGHQIVQDILGTLCCPTSFLQAAALTLSGSRSGQDLLELHRHSSSLRVWQAEATRGVLDTS